MLSSFVETGLDRLFGSVSTRTKTSRVCSTVLLYGGTAYIF